MKLKSWFKDWIWYYSSILEKNDLFFMPTTFCGDDGHIITLPDCLFYPSDAKSKNISPAAVLDPAAALGGGGWKSATAPSSRSAKKTIIINKDTFASPPDVAEAIAFIARLKSAGFNIVARVDDILEPFVQIDDDLSDIEKYLCSLAPFNSKEDPKRLAKINVSCDRSVVVRRGIRSEIEEMFLTRGYNPDTDSWSRARDVYGLKSYFYKFRYIPESLMQEELKYYDYLIDKYRRDRNSVLCDAQQVKIFHDHYYSEKPFKRQGGFRRSYPRTYSPASENPEPEWYDRIFTPEALQALARDPASVNAIIQERLAEIGQTVTWKEISDHDDASGIRCAIIKRFAPDGEVLAGLPFIIQEIEYLKQKLSQEKVQFIFRKIRKVLLYKIESGDYFESLERMIFIVGEWIGCIDFEEGKELIEELFYLQKKGERLKDEGHPIEGERSLIEEVESFISHIAKHNLDFQEFILKKSFVSEYLKQDVILCNKVSGADLVGNLFTGGNADYYDYYYDDDDDRQSYQGDIHDIFMDTLPMDFRYELEIFEGWFEQYIRFEQDPIITLFHINKLCEESLPLILKHLEKLNCSQLSSIRIINFEGGGALINELLAHPKFAKVKHVVLPQECKDLEFEGRRCGFSFVDFSIFRLDSLKLSQIEQSILQRRRVEKIFREKGEGFREEGIEAVMRPVGSFIRPGVGHKRSRKIAIGSDGNIPSHLEVTVGDEVSICRKVNCGEILSGDDTSELYVRTQLFDRDITKDLKQIPYVAREYRDVDVEILSEEDIKVLKSAPADSDSFYRFNLSIKAGGSYRLSSVRSQEELVGVLVSNGSNITIKRGDDDFFYASCDANCDLSYVIKAEAIEPSYKDIPAECPIRLILDDYMNPAKGFKMTADDASLIMPEYKPESHEEWLREVYEKRLGSCRHRVAAVEYKMLTNGVSADDLRAVDINNNHVVIEVRHEGSWYSVDLGGDNRMRLIESNAEYEAQSTQQQRAIQERGRILDEEKKDSRRGGSTEKDEAIGEEERKAAPAPPDALRRAVDPERPGALPPLPEIELEPEPEFPPSPLDEAFERAKQVEYASDMEGLFAATINSSKSRVLITAGDVDAHANSLLFEASVRQRRLVFYIDDPAKIDFDCLKIWLDEDRVDGQELVGAKVKREGDLGKFLTACKDSQPSSPVLMINWSNFNPRQKLALNRLLSRI